MKLVKRILCGALAVVTMLGLCACGGKEFAKNTGATTKLKMVLVGDKPAIYDEIYGEVNKMLKEDINAELEIEYMPYSDMDKKYALLFSGEDDFDLVFSANWIDYTKYAQKNCFMEITDEMLKKNAPQTYSKISKENLNDARVNGKIFMVPVSTTEYDQRVVMLRGDLRKKYNLAPPENWDDFYNYLKTVAENEPSIIPVCELAGAGTVWNLMEGDNYTNCGYEGVGVCFDLDKNKFVVRVEEPGYEKLCNRRRQMVEDKIIPSDMLANKTLSSMFSQGRAAVYMHNLDTVATLYVQYNESHPDWEVEIYDFSQGSKKVTQSATIGGISINRKSKNSEKALALIDLLRNDERYFNLTWYGIENKHWRRVGENGVDLSLNKALPKEEQYSPGCVWGWKNQDMMLRDSQRPQVVDEILERWKTETVPNPLSGFNYDDTNFKVQVANLSSVGKQYESSLKYGMIEKDQIHSYITEFQDSMKKAGVEEVCQSMQEQYDEFLKGQK